MLIRTLALLAQNAGLPAGTAEAARICTAIELRSMAGEPNLADMSRALHFNLLAARETRGSGRMLDNLQAEQALVNPRITGETDDLALRADCRKRFPQAWATRATLPENAFDRLTLCVAATGSMAGLAGSIDNDAGEARWQSVSERLNGLPLLSNAEARKRGITSLDLMKDHSDRLVQQTLDTSGMLVVAQACEAAYPA